MRRVRGQAHDECRPSPYLARNTDASAVRSDKFGDDCQPQSRATAVLAPRPRLLQPVEALEDSWQFFFRNARAVIGNDTLDRANSVKGMLSSGIAEQMRRWRGGKEERDAEG